MGKVKLILMAAMTLCLSVALAGVASAAAINCGDCHGTTPVNADNCAGTARGLHGTHVNYSSATYKKTVAAYGKCAYCHPTQVDTHPSTTHINGFTNITGANTVNTIHAVGLKEDASKNCSNACHKNAGQTAKWGNYTATVVGGIVLNCQSCHDDITQKTTTAMSGKHKEHLMSNCTTPGAYGLMGAAANAGCANCHVDQRNDLWSGGPKADDGTKKAYPHASDGTNVVAESAATANNISVANKTGNPSTLTCTNACHYNTATVQWGAASIACDVCHYWNASPSLAGNNAATVKLGGAHSKHFNSNVNCPSCHATPGDGTHARSLIVVSGSLRASYLAAVSAGLSYTRPGKTCTANSVGCHGPLATPSWDSVGNGCTTCHYYPGGGARDWSGVNGHVIKNASPLSTHLLLNASYSITLDSYSSVVNDNTKCGQCHHVLKSKHNNATTDLATVGSGNCGGNFSITAGKVSGVTVTCDSVKCHSGKTTPNWW